MNDSQQNDSRIFLAVLSCSVQRDAGTCGTNSIPMEQRCTLISGCIHAYRIHVTTGDVNVELPGVVLRTDINTSS